MNPHRPHIYRARSSRERRDNVLCIQLYALAHGRGWHAHGPITVLRVLAVVVPRRAPLGLRILTGTRESCGSLNGLSCRCKAAHTLTPPGLQARRGSQRPCFERLDIGGFEPALLLVKVGLQVGLDGSERGVGSGEVWTENMGLGLNLV